MPTALLVPLLVLASAPAAPDSRPIVRPSVGISFGSTNLGGVEAGLDIGVVRFEGGAAWTWAALSRGAGELTAYARGGLHFEIFDAPTKYGVRVHGELAPLAEVRQLNAFDHSGQIICDLGPCPDFTPRWGTRGYWGGGLELRFRVPLRNQLAITFSAFVGGLVGQAAPAAALDAQSTLGVSF